MKDKTANLFFASFLSLSCLTTTSFSSVVMSSSVSLSSDLTPSKLMRVVQSSECFRENEPHSVMEVMISNLVCQLLELFESLGHTTPDQASWIARF